VAVLEVVVRGPFVVGTQFFKHFVENAPARGSSRFLAIRNGDKVVRRGFLFARLILLLVPLRALIGAHGILVLVLPLVLVTTKDGTNCLLTGDEVGDGVYQAIGSDRGAAAQLSDQLFTGGTREEGHDDIGVGDVGKLGVLFGETPDVVPEGFARLLFTASEVP
jgi:hypothetical protein